MCMKMYVCGLQLKICVEVGYSLLSRYTYKCEWMGKSVRARVGGGGVYSLCM